ncbi:MAG: sugar phosphate nucleotidyltransferase [Proteobacteria bacterium]|nr:sugar phosphate nucleotidyltransferase [Pseudomonadota bacterium]
MQSLKDKFLPNVKDCIVAYTATIKDGLAAIGKSGAQLAAVVDSKGVLLGIFTDSDARRAILAGASVSDSIATYLGTNPVVGRFDAEPDELRQLAQSEGIREIPLIDSDGRLADVFVVVAHEQRMSIQLIDHSSASTVPLSNPMFLIAGGMGTRLRAVVNDRPKPLAVVGGKPIIQTIIQNAVASGIHKFYVSVNYQAELIVEHLKSDCYAGLKIECLHEEEFLGTAGSLGFLGAKWNEAIVVSNADILSNISISQVLQAHCATAATATCVVRPFHVQVPFGVVELGASGVVGIVEKPVHKHIVNTGIYVLSPAASRFIRPGKRLDMPDLLRMMVEAGDKVVPFLMHEYWRDVGRPEEFVLANEEYNEIFGDRH